MYGKDAFSVKKLYECPKDELDLWEKEYINKLNTLYPNGYNLTVGGKGAWAVEASDVEELQVNTPGKRGGCKERSADTRAKISAANKKAFNSEETKTSLMKRTQIQHSENKLNKFKGLEIDLTKIDQYIYERSKFIIVKVDNIRTTFVGKYETKEVLRERAREFLKQIATLAMLPNCSGNP